MPNIDGKPKVNIGNLLTTIRADPTLSDEDKAKIMDLLSRQDYVNKLLNGALGAGLALLIARYMNLSKASQVLLAIAGFGVGKLILDSEQGDPKKRFASYNRNIKMYELNQKPS